MTIRVHGFKAGCAPCTATCRALDARGIPYEFIDLDADETALEFVKALGFAQSPVVVTDDDRWSGFRPDKIVELSRALARQPRAPRCD